VCTTTTTSPINNTFRHYNMLQLISKTANKAVLARPLIRFSSSCAVNTNTWSSSLFFASPESDFTAAESKNDVLDHIEKNEGDRSRLAYSLSFAQAESDYTSLLLTDEMKEQLSNVNSLNTVEEPRKKILDHMEQNDNDRSRLVYGLSFAQAESDYTSLLLTDEMKEQLSNVKPLNASNNEVHDSPLPTTLEEALQASNEARVITDVAHPFRITNVNKAWEELCGFQLDECYGKSMRMIQGPETDVAAIEAAIDHVMTGETAGIVLTNYRKDGSKFRNRLRVSPLYGENGDQITHLIGVLQEIQDLSANRNIQASI